MKSGERNDEPPVQTTAERVAKIEEAASLLARARELIDRAWGLSDADLAVRQATPTPYMRLADAGSLLDRGQQKLRTSLELFKREISK